MSSAVSRPAAAMLVTRRRAGECVRTVPLSSTGAGGRDGTSSAATVREERRKGREGPGPGRGSAVFKPRTTASSRSRIIWNPEEEQCRDDESRTITRFVFVFVETLRIRPWKVRRGFLPEGESLSGGGGWAATGIADPSMRTRTNNGLPFPFPFPFPFPPPSTQRTLPSP